MNLVVDYGNSSAKVAIFNHLNLIEKHTFLEMNELKSFLQHSAAENLIVSSVTKEADQITEWAVNAKQKFILSHTLPLPVTLLYKTPHTLGVDRIAGACGALQLFPGFSSLVIDAGSCITYDFIDATGNYHGGGISPGLMMRFKAVHTFTARLPLINPTENPELIGNSTESSIQSGVIYGLAAEIDGIITRYRSQFPDLKVILCGGDTLFFENKLKDSIFASPDLVLIGLNSVLIHNVVV
ncbi:MAG TPA: type III pantothenate kinase [Cyclobacteriaceae bacterium]|nr:type III pantothenate kinase [Cyclobacteriaceae bacterium]